MITWAQIIVLLLGIIACVATVAACDITIIKEIKKLRNVFKILITTLLNKEEE